MPPKKTTISKHEKANQPSRRRLANVSLDTETPGIINDDPIIAHQQTLVQNPFRVANVEEPNQPSRRSYTKRKRYLNNNNC